MIRLSRLTSMMLGFVLGLAVAAVWFRTVPGQLEQADRQTIRATMLGQVNQDHRRPGCEGTTVMGSKGAQDLQFSLEGISRSAIASLYITYENRHWRLECDSSSWGLTVVERPDSGVDVFIEPAEPAAKDVVYNVEITTRDGWTEVLRVPGTSGLWNLALDRN